MKKEGIGSYFHNITYDPKIMESIVIDLKSEVFYSGRHALVYILNEITSKISINKIWFPNYYCQHTLHWIKKSYPQIDLYSVNPFDFKDAVNSFEFCGGNDIVLVNNYWGLSKMISKIDTVDRPVIIEDHSHGWLSPGSLNSSADFCFASLRKSLPIPLGGIAWQPRNLGWKNQPLTNSTINHYTELWELMDAGMHLKTKFMTGVPGVSPEDYLNKFYQVENHLNENFDLISPITKHKEFIKKWMQVNVLKSKNINLSYLYHNIDPNPYFRIIKDGSATAFGLHLLFKDSACFDSLRSFLVQNYIYPSHLWPDNKLKMKWRYFLNIHVDLRYNLQDMKHVIETINQWVGQQNKR